MGVRGFEEEEETRTGNRLGGMLRVGSREGLGQGSRRDWKIPGEGVRTEQSGVVRGQTKSSRCRGDWGWQKNYTQGRGCSRRHLEA